MNPKHCHLSLLESLCLAQHVYAHLRESVRYSGRVDVFGECHVVSGGA